MNNEYQIQENEIPQWTTEPRKQHERPAFRKVRPTMEPPATKKIKKRGPNHQERK